jgi:hypothetical protein
MKGSEEIGEGETYNSYGGRYTILLGCLSFREIEKEETGEGDLQFL